MLLSIHRTFFITCLALIAFAANSVISRLAFTEQSIDPTLFTAIRLLSGAIMLLLLVMLTRNKVAASPPPSVKTKGTALSRSGSWLASVALFTYALCFSIAYVELATGTGALVLFASVQVTLIIIAIMQGYRLMMREWCGLLVAFVGFVYLVLPSIESPSVLGFVLMIASGISWAIYTVLGLKSTSPLLDSCSNFIRTLPFTLLLLVVAISYYPLTLYAETTGIMLAVTAGAITSGLGYFLWYLVLPKFSSTQAGVLQLSVPLIATLGGIALVNEALTLRIAISATLILLGILLLLLNKHK